ncbi:hypothetical protein ABXI76_36215 [Streptomyces parvus]
MALAQSVDGSSDAVSVNLTAQLDSGLQWEAGFGERFLAVMETAGWLEQGKRP